MGAALQHATRLVARDLDRSGTSLGEHCLFLVMSGSDDRAELATWRRGLASPFLLALPTMAAVVLVALDAHGNVRGVGSAAVGTVLTLAIVLACVSSFALVSAAALYGAFRILAWGYGLRKCIHPRLRILFWSTALLAGSASVWLGALSHLDTAESDAAVLSGTLLFLGSTIGLLVTETSITMFRGLTVDEGGLRLAKGARYIEFRTLSTLRVFQDGLLDTDYMAQNTAVSLEHAPATVARNGRVLVAQDQNDEVVVEFALKGHPGRRLEEELKLAYDLWARRPRRAHGLPISWLSRGQAPLPSWLSHLARESDRLLREGAYRGAGYGVDGLLDVFLDESLAQDIRAGAAFVLLRFLPDEERCRVFDAVGAMSPPLVSAAAWVGAKRSVRRRRQPYGLECLAREDRELIRKAKSDAWLPWRRDAVVA